MARIWVISVNLQPKTGRNKVFLNDQNLSNVEYDMFGEWISEQNMHAIREMEEF